MMNSEQLIAEAGAALAQWQRNHHAPCRLYVFEGHVRCRVFAGPATHTYAELRITPLQQKRGFSSAQWGVIGAELFNLYKKDIKCRTHQKHSQ